MRRLLQVDTQKLLLSWDQEEFDDFISGKLIVQVKDVRCSVGYDRACVISEKNELICWGRLLTLPTDPSKPFKPMPDDLGRVRDISFGTDHTCVMKWNQELECWGYNQYGQSSIEQFREIQIKSVAAGSFHNCAILANNTLACWGQNKDKQIIIPTNLTRGIRDLTEIPRITSE